MIFVHNFWIKPLEEKKYGIETEKQMLTNLYCYALSYTYLHNQGQTVNLYADSLGLDFLSPIPYDNTFETKISGSTRFWAQGKFHAFEGMRLGEIYLDGDVFIKSQKSIDKFLQPFDIMIQTIEDDRFLNCEMIEKARSYYSDFTLPTFHPQEKLYACNTGVVCFKNPELKQRYIDLYREIMSAMENRIDLSSIPLDSNLDVLAEQQSLFELWKDGDYELVPFFSDPTGPFLKINENDYTHLVSGRKYTLLPLVKLKLEKLNPELFHTIKEEYENGSKLKDIIKQL